MNQDRPTLADIEAAARNPPDAIMTTPCVPSETFSVRDDAKAHRVTGIVKPFDQGNILLLATGGTIASEVDPAGRKNFASLGGTIDALLRIVGGSWPNLRGEQLAAIGSQDMNLALWRHLGARIDQAFSTEDIDAVVITHGTDTMEETAFLLDLITSPDRVIILVGAMRAANALGAEGPRNLVAAVRVAADAATKGRGVLVVMNDTILDARSMTKADTMAVHAFRSARGPIGRASPSEVVYFARPAPSISAGRLTLPLSGPLPKVGIVYCHADMDTLQVDALLAQGAAGIVLAGLGDGNIPRSTLARLSEAASQGVTVVRSTRIDGGEVSRNAEIDDDMSDFIAARDLSPHKSRLLLQLLLANGVNRTHAIQRRFDPS